MCGIVKTGRRVCAGRRERGSRTEGGGKGGRVGGWWGGGGGFAPCIKSCLLSHLINVSFAIPLGNPLLFHNESCHS